MSRTRCWMMVLHIWKPRVKAFHQTFIFFQTLTKWTWNGSLRGWQPRQAIGTTFTSREDGSGANVSWTRTRITTMPIRILSLESTSYNCQNIKWSQNNTDWSRSKNHPDLKGLAIFTQPSCVLWIFSRTVVRNFFFKGKIMVIEKWREATHQLSVQGGLHQL